MIGIVYRGTDYRSLKPKGHPQQPNIEEILEFIRLNGLKNEVFFVSSEEGRIVEELKSSLPYVEHIEREYYDKVFYNEESQFTHISQILFSQFDNPIYKQSKEYFTEVCILSMCDGIIGSNCGASRMAVIMNGGKYKINGIFDLGLYS